MPKPNFEEGSQVVTNPEPTHYVPGYVKSKVLVIVFTLLIFAYGLSELWTPLMLLLTGPRALAEVTQVVKTKAGLPDKAFTDPLALSKGLETKDNGYVFWDEFRFTTKEGAVQNVRLNIGARMQPLFPLLDEDGLPTTVSLCYDPKNPLSICIPTVLSTWFAPGLITALGLLGAMIGAVLLAFAKRPIPIL